MSRRLERGAALDQRRAGDEGLRQHVARVLAEHVEAAGPLGGLHADRDREGARLDHRVADQVGGEEPVVAGDAAAHFSGSSGRSPLKVFWL